MSILAEETVSVYWEVVRGNFFTRHPEHRRLEQLLVWLAGVFYYSESISSHRHLPTFVWIWGVGGGGVLQELLEQERCVRGLCRSHQLLFH